MKDYIIVIGGGLAGTEAALQLSKRGIKVKLYEMRPEKTTGAHVTGDYAEFVCSNSLGAADCSNASGLLKKEMQILGGELINIAFENSVPAGGALAIDRVAFSKIVTDKIPKPATSAKEAKEVDPNRGFHYIYILIKKKKA